MRLEYYDKEKLQQDIIEIVSRYLAVSRYRVFFFGSRVTGKGNDRSDVDVGIIGSEKVPSDYMRRIKDDVESIPTLYKIDVVDFGDVSESFRSVAMQKVEYITNEMYDKKNSSS